MGALGVHWSTCVKKKRHSPLSLLVHTNENRVHDGFIYFCRIRQQQDRQTCTFFIFLCGSHRFFAIFQRIVLFLAVKEGGVGRSFSLNFEGVVQYRRSNGRYCQVLNIGSGGAMPRQLYVKISFLYVLPTLVLASCCALCIVGNLLYLMTTVEAFTGYKISWWVWGAKGCDTTTGTCTIYGTQDIDQVLSPTSDCSSWLRQLRAAEAFGIISSFASGVATIGSVALILYQQLLTFPRVVVLGQVMCSVVTMASLMQFALTVTLVGRACIATRKTASTTFDAAAFLYLGSFILSVLCAFLYRAIGQCEDSDSQRRVVSAPNDRPYSTSPSVPRSTGTGTVVAVPHGPPAARGNMFGEPSSARPSSSPQPEVELQVLPEGDDWEFDQESGLMWSDERKLFFDQGSGHFYDPGSEQWYDPDGGKWYTINADGVMIETS